MPIGVGLEKICRSQNVSVLQSARHEAETVGQVFFAEAAGHGQGRQST